MIDANKLTNSEQQNILSNQKTLNTYFIGMGKCLGHTLRSIYSHLMTFSNKNNLENIKYKDIHLEFKRSDSTVFKNVSFKIPIYPVIVKAIAEEDHSSTITKEHFLAVERLKLPSL